MAPPKGFIPWNKGLKGIHLSPATEFKKGQHPSPKTEFKKGHKPKKPIKKGQRISPETEFTTARTKDEKNNKWAGERVGYFASHGWVQRTYGKANRCQNRDEQILGFPCTNESSRFEWAFKLKKGHKRDVNLYYQLCKSCHAKYDKQ